jgi:hypothetical protein
MRLVVDDPAGPAAIERANEAAHLQRSPVAKAGHAEQLRMLRFPGTVANQMMIELIY